MHTPFQLVVDPILDYNIAVASYGNLDRVCAVVMVVVLGLRHSGCRRSLANQASIDLVVFAKIQLWLILLITRDSGTVVVV